MSNLDSGKLSKSAVITLICVLKLQFSIFKGCCYSFTDKSKTNFMIKFVTHCNWVILLKPSNLFNFIFPWCSFHLWIFPYYVNWRLTCGIYIYSQSRAIFLFVEYETKVNFYYKRNHLFHLFIQFDCGFVLP